MTALYNVAALVGMFLCIYVMQATEHDRINRTDLTWIQWMRRAAFTFAALVLAYSILCNDWIRYVPVILMIVAADFLLFVNAIALAWRKSTSGNRPQRVHVNLKRRAF